MFKKILIANRGEIALRIVRACKDMGIASVAVYSEADCESLHVRTADESYCIGPASVKDSYLNIANIISAAIVSGADAIHPGYGLLSENVRFAEICASHGIVFIGPSIESIQAMGDKARARETMISAGVPVVPGSPVLKNFEDASEFAEKTGYPVMLKAVSGGGGKGMRILRNSQDLEKQFHMAQREAAVSFGDDRMYLEKFIDSARHIEFQILADKHGNIVHLGERDCSSQRRNQKLVEESPSPALTKELREQMGEAAVKAAAACNYFTVGTVEFIYDLSENKFYFMEMNTRIQVEHPVTEMVTSVDLLKEQIKTAAGEKISFSKDDIKLRGHSIECRINSEDPFNNFSPSTGTISKLLLPGGPGIRIDTHIYQSATVSPFYDSLLAKIIAFGNNREEALAVLDRALSEFVIEGVKTTIPFHKAFIRSEAFRSGNISTSFVERNLDSVLATARFDKK